MKATNACRPNVTSLSICRVFFIEPHMADIRY